MKAQNNSDVKISDRDLPEITKPNLNGHNFIITSSFKGPFISTSIKTLLGAGQTLGLELPAVRLDTFTLNRDIGSILITSLDVEYEAQIREWLSFYLSYQIYGRLGTKTTTLVAQGVNLASGYQIGMMFKLWEKKNMLLSGTVNVSNKSYTIIDLENYISGIIENGFDENDLLVYSIPSLSVLGGANYAWAIDRSWGLVATLELGYGESINKSSNDNFLINTGVSVDFDLLPRSKVPIGFNLGYYNNSFPALSGDRIGNPQNFFGQIAYTGRNDLAAGFELSYQFSKPESYNTDGKVTKFLTIYGNLKYYF
ncbi:MAG TPA: hypothetical protein PK294_12535 [Ignavibacteria bacterium]|nr:hypothetical protein [Ignavibacteria bacterium]HQY51538.1 hypothetical protein [Ignavibacteria bacterium]HRB01254.1 hypothetical protein [Ignavibacteria bacterium]